MTGSAGGVLIKPRPNSGKVSPATTMTMGDQNMSREGSRGATAAPSSAGYHRPTSYYTAPTSPPPASEPVGPSSASIFKSSLDEIMILPRSSSLPFSLSATARASSDRYASPQPLAANSQKHRSIASLYPSPSSSSATLPTSISLPNVRKSLKAPVRFNVVVMGARETGKTAMIRTILETLQFQKATAATMQSKVADFVGKATTATKPTTREQEISIDCVVAAGEKINLNIIDTVGLEVPFSVGRGGDELEVYRQIGAMVKNVEERFEQTLVEVSLSFPPVLFLLHLNGVLRLFANDTGIIDNSTIETSRCSNPFNSVPRPSRLLLSFNCNLFTLLPSIRLFFSSEETRDDGRGSSIE